MSSTQPIVIQLDAARATQLLDAVRRGLTVLTPLYNALAFTAKNLAAGQFVSQQAPDGTPWKPLAQSTLAQRRQQGRGGVDILRDIGILLNSIDASHDATSATLTIGAPTRPAAIHNYGGRAGRGGRTTIAARPFISEDPNLAPHWDEAFTDVLKLKINELFPNV